MLNIKKLAHSLFFKLFIALLILSFAFFGVSNFVLNGSNSWAAKVGGKTISYSRLVKAMQADRESIIRANPKNTQALEYVESDKFKSDVLGRLVNQAIIEKLQDEFGVEASKKIILESIASDPQFKRDGKFDRAIFKNFLTQNGFDEEKYLKALQDEIVGAMIISSVSKTSPVDENLAIKVANLKEEKRAADVIIVSLKDVGKLENASAKELEEYFAKNKQKFVAPEMRQISYIATKQQDLASSIVISEQDLLQEYEKNKENYQQPEKRNFYHLLFVDEKKANEFLSALEKQGSGDKSKIFIETAKKVAGKNLKEISLSNISNKDLLPEITNDAFALKKGEFSKALKSSLGYHIFFLESVKAPTATPFAQVKNDIKQNLLTNKSEEILTKKLSEIEDNLLTTNSIFEVAKKFGFKVSGQVKINQNGADEKGSAALPIKDLQDFAKNAFLLKEKQNSKLYYSQNGYIYALKIDKIEPEHEKKLEEIKDEIAANYQKEKAHKKLQELATNIYNEIINKPEEALQIAAKNHLKIEKNKIFNRFIYLEFQGKKIPYSSKFLEELFSARINQVTSPAIIENNQEFNIAVLREIKKAEISQNQVVLVKNELEKTYRAEFFQQFNKFLQKKYPIKVNEKLLEASTKQE